MLISTQTCPCQITPTSDTVSTLLAYSDCCQPYHDDMKKADTAERLMRTRYSAFVLVKPEYIVKTTLSAQQDLLDIKAIEAWATETDWAGLEIVAHTPKLGKRHAQVEFKAYFNMPDGKEQKQQAHHEISTFIKIKNKADADNSASCYFLDPTISMPVTQKQPCICGSGEKFKRCCGVYI